MPQIGSIRTATISISASGDTTVSTPSATQRIAVVGYVLVNGVGTAQSVTFKSASTAITGAMPLSTAAVPLVVLGSRRDPVFATNGGEALVINLSAATLVTGHIQLLFAET